MILYGKDSFLEWSHRFEEVYDVLFRVIALVISLLKLHDLIVRRTLYWDYLDRVRWSPFYGGRLVFFLSDHVFDHGMGEERVMFTSYTSWLPYSQKVTGVSEVTLPPGSSDTGSMIGLVGTGPGFALSSVTTSIISRCARCWRIKVGAHLSMVLLRALDGCPANRKVASLWVGEA